MAKRQPKPWWLGGAVLAALLAIGIGILQSPISRPDSLPQWRRYSFPSWVVNLLPSTFVGLLPCFTPAPWGYTFQELERLDLRGQSALITGANSGIGFEISRALSRRGASVTMACRNPQRCFAAVDKVRKEDGYSGAAVHPLIMDVSDLASVQKAARTYLHHNEGALDMLFLNAGIAFYADSGDDATKLPVSKDGIEMVFATNVVGHHLLYRILEPALQQSHMARVVLTSSLASIWWLPPYALPWRFGDQTTLIPATVDELNAGTPSMIQTLTLYGRSKLAQVAWSRALTRRLGESSSIYVNNAHPGAVFTALAPGQRNAPGMPRILSNIALYLEELLLWTSEEGALTELYLGADAGRVRNGDLRGKYFHPQGMEYEHPHAGDEELQENVWNLCEDLVKGLL